MNKQRRNDLINKLRSHLDDCNFDHVEAERQAVPVDYDDDLNLPD